jgi:methionine biosynthesis protein MetW
MKRDRMKKYPAIGYERIMELVDSGSRVLDLGCGSGELLERLQKEKNVTGLGVEISESNVALCVDRGLYCYQGDIDEGLSDYRDNSFDVVILNQTIQSTKRPHFVISECLRIGRKVIISFPNFGHYSVRAQLFFTGTMPRNNILPYEWYDSPNIHLVTIDDFRKYCMAKNIAITNEWHFSRKKNAIFQRMVFLSNIRAEYGMFTLELSGK